MTPEDIQRRWTEIDRQLADLADGKVVDGDPGTIEGELLEEMDELDYEAGEKYFRERNAKDNG